MKMSFLFWLLALLLMGWCYSTQAAPPPPNRSLAYALNPDGTLRPGAAGSFNAHAFRLHTAADGQPVFRAAGIGDEHWSDGFGLPNGASGEVNAVALVGNTLYIGGNFTAVGNVAANCVAKWDGTAWSSLGTGPANGVSSDDKSSDEHMSGHEQTIVFALALAGNGDLYVGGIFTKAGNVAASHIARWNGSTWSALGNGAGNKFGRVQALAVAGNGDVYAAGRFARTSRAASYLARWNGKAWSSLGKGLSGGHTSVGAVAVAGNGDVYVGGNFTHAGNVEANNVARWDGKAWSSLGTGRANGISTAVSALAVAGNETVYVGGDFARAGEVKVAGVAKWNGTTWSRLGTSSQPLWVYALAVAANGDVYAGGYSAHPDSLSPASAVVKWNGTTWSNVQATTTSGVNNMVSALAVGANGDVYAGGDFTHAGGASASHLAQWNGTAWKPVGTGTGNSVGDCRHNYVAAIAVASNGDVYVGGNFALVGGVAANCVAKWNGKGWSSLGTGAANGVAKGTVYALAVASNGDVYVGGSFDLAGGILTTGIAKWNGSTWSALGTGLVDGTNATHGSAYTLAVAGNGNVYVGGFFTQAGNVPANHVAKWDGKAWSSLGTGAANGVNAGRLMALAVAANGDVYVGGYFTQAGTIAANGVAKWNGTAWAALGTGLTWSLPSTSKAARPSGGYAEALAVAANGDVYVGGNFIHANGITANYVAKWNGKAWSSLGAGIPYSSSDTRISALALASNGDVHVGGVFTQAGRVAASCVAKWNGTSWEALGTGVNSSVAALAVSPAGQLYVGGSFTALGDGSKAAVHFGLYDSKSP